MTSPRDDQVDAAIRETRRVLDASAHDWGVEVIERDTDDPSDPTKTALLRKIREAAQQGELRACPHISSPQPLCLTAWDLPLTVKCALCFALTPSPQGEADYTCDCCGKVDPSGMWPVQIAMGPIMIFFGRCDDCTPQYIKDRDRG